MNQRGFRGYEPLTCPPPVDRQPRIVICAVQVPFISGGAERLVESLSNELVARNYWVDIVRLPFKWHPVRQIINDAIAWRMIDVTSSYGLPIDLAIVTRFPSYCIRHPRKVAWILHQHRQAYDFLNSSFSDFTDLPDDDEVRKLLYEVDSRSLKECRKIFTISNNVTNRMKHYLDIDSSPLFPPPPLFGRYNTSCYDDYVFTASRLELNKRPDLLIHALALTRNPIKAVIAGVGPLEKSLKNMAIELGIDHRLTFVGFISDEELIAHYSQCGLVWYAPLDEDYGYVTLEAFSSAKPVITSTDSGGVLEFVEDGVNGYVGEPEPQSLAEQLDRWYDHREKAPDLGRNGRRKIETVVWDIVIDRLTETLRDDIKEAENKLRKRSGDA